MVMDIYQGRALGNAPTLDAIFYVGGLGTYYGRTCAILVARAMYML